MSSVARFDTWQAADGTNVARFSGGKLETWDGSAWVTSEVGTLAASGGTELTSGAYKYHTFTSSGTLTVSSAGIGEVLLVGGGGAGGSDGGSNNCGGRQLWSKLSK